MAHNVTEFYARNTLNYSTATGMWLNTNSLSVVSIILILINFIKILCTATGVDIQVQSVSAEGAA